jgi:hypothetical protein
MEFFYCDQHNCGGTGSCSKCNPKPIHDTVWAISKSAELARVAERERIIAILEAELTYKEHDLRVFLIDKINGAV